MPDFKWYALQVNATKEVTIATLLGQKGYEQFLPLWRRDLGDTKEKRRKAVPLFPGYVFCRIDLTVRLAPVVTTPGVIRLVGIRSTPGPIPDDEMASLQLITSSSLPVEPCDAVAAGDRVQIIGGPLTGAVGILRSVHGRDRLVVEISLLNRAASVEVNRSSVRPVNATQGVPALAAKHQLVGYSSPVDVSPVDAGLNEFSEPMERYRRV